jgi:HAD superfamily phosphoserine phosphatase-like hydrolase
MSNNKPDLVIYDFCETLVSIQTADRFINYVVDETKTKSFISNLEKFLTLTRLFAIIKLILPKLNLSKKINLLKIRNFNELQLKEIAIKYYEEIIKSNYNHIILEKLKQDLEKKNLVMVISGGYDMYLNLFCKEFGIDYLLSSKIEIVESKATGFLKGKDCMFNEKVIQLEKFIWDKKLEFENSIVYSDSITDLPLFNWAKEKYVISYNKNQNWVKQNNFREIILKRDAC